jgi:hypothetical protein
VQADTLRTSTARTFRVRVELNLKGMVVHEIFVNMDAGE